MKTLVAALFTALVVFALATAWMEVVQPRMDLLARASALKAEEAEAKSAKRRTSRKAAARAVSDTDDIDEDSLDEDSGNVASKASRRTRASRDSSDKSEERLLTQLEKVKQQEAKLVERQAALELIYRDIYRELAEVEEIRRRSAAELALAEQKISSVATNVAPEPVAIATRPSETNRTAAVTPKPRMVAEARIAGVIHDLAKQGKIPAAASLLSGMKDRDVAKVLMSLSARDPGLALQLSDQVQATKQSTIRR